MKRLLLIGLLLIGVGQVATFAQNDDIYFNSSDIEKQKQQDKIQAQRLATQRSTQYGDNQDDGSYQDSNGSYQSYGHSYGNDGYNDYNDYDNGYTYASRINRFDNSFYNMGYWSVFYNPYWYNPYWYDPNWGWSAWNRPMYSMNYGYGPYWNSYWGWYTWWGYPAYYSCWNYPYYGGWYGGNPYYSGYWNGYYAGIYNQNTTVRNVNYGPRNSTNAIYNNAGVRQLSNSNQTGGNVGAGVRPPARALPSNSAGTRVSERPNGSINTQPDRTPNSVGNIDRPNRSSFSRGSEPVRDFSDRSIRMDENTRPSYNSGRVDGNRSYNEVPRNGGYRQPQQYDNGYRNQQPQQYQQPRYEQPQYQQPRFEQPRYEQPRMQQPSYSAPRMEAPSRGGFGGGGGNMGGGGRSSGGGFGGRR